MCGHRRYVFNRILITLRLTINKHDLMKLKDFCKAKDTINIKNSILSNGKRSSAITHVREDSFSKQTQETGHQKA